MARQVDKALIVLALVLGFDGAAGSPPIYRFPIVALERVADATVVTIGAGTKSGLHDKWVCSVVDKNNRRLENGELTIVRVTERTTKARTSKLSHEQLSNNPQVLCYPG